ncbi:MAG: Manganese catalase, partial [uncultured Acetobacteraceae bacterium]
DRRRGHEGHVGLPHRPRHHAPAAVAGGDQGVGRHGEAAPDPELLPAGAGAHAVLLRLLRARQGEGGAGRALDQRPLARRQGPIQRHDLGAAGRRADPATGPARRRRPGRADQHDASAFGGGERPSAGRQQLRRL